MASCACTSLVLISLMHRTATAVSRIVLIDAASMRRHSQLNFARIMEVLTRADIAALADSNQRAVGAADDAILNTVDAGVQAARKQQYPLVRSD